jgi:zinc protease
MEKIVDTFGGATNAYTSTDETVYFIDCPAKRIMTCIELVADTMQHCKFEKVEFDREFKVVQQELADGQVNRLRVRWKLLNKTVYTEHPVRHPVIGYLDVLRNLKRQDCIDFFHERYVPNNQVLVVVGDVDTRKVLDHVAEQWAGTPRGPETFVSMPDEPLQVSPREAVHEMDGATYDMVLAWPTVKLSHPDLYALDVAAFVLAHGESSRLVRKLKHDEQLVLSVDSASYTPHFVNGVFAILASCPPETWERASEEILREVYRLRDELVSPDELAKAKKQKSAGLIFSQQTIQMASRCLGGNFLSTGDPLFEKHYAENIQKVTAEQVRDVARRYLLPYRLNRIIIAPSGGAPKTVHAEETGDAGEVRAVRLPNGLRVLIKQHSHLPMVNMQAYVLCGGLVDTPETAGRSALVAAMLNKGTARHGAQRIAEYYDSIGGGLSMSAGRYTIYGRTTVLREDFPEAAAMMAECFTKPTFPADEFKKARQLALGAIAQRADSPHKEIFEVFFDTLPADSPYHVLQGGKTDSVNRLTVDDLRAYHAKYFVPNNMLVTVFGDIDPDEALALVRRNFGDLKPDKDLEPFDFNRDNALPEPIVRHKQIGKPTGMILLSYQAPSILNKEDYAAMTVLDAVMSGYNFPGGWLHNELRGQGLVYFVHAYQLTGASPGFFTVFSQTRPDKIDEVVGRIRKNIERARSGKISREEFGTAIEMILALHAQENTTISEQAQQAALNELYGLGYDYDKTFDERIKAVTLDDVVRVARQYLGKSILVTTSPASAEPVPAER